MSKKTVTFKMPATEPPPPESAGAPDDWVRRGDMDHEAVALAPPWPAPALKRRVTIDLAAERHFGEAVALALLAPPMLGWFWLFHAMKRYDDSFG
jgi:hypothetical protein